MKRHFFYILIASLMFSGILNAAQTQFREINKEVLTQLVVENTDEILSKIESTEFKIEDQFTIDNDEYLLYQVKVEAEFWKHSRNALILITKDQLNNYNYIDSFISDSSHPYKFRLLSFKADKTRFIEIIKDYSGNSYTDICISIYRIDKKGFIKAFFEKLGGCPRIQK